MHIQSVTAERDVYRDRRELSELQPAKYLSIIMDAADPITLPHPGTLFPKTWLRVQRLGLHLYGIINHGHDERILYYCFDFWPGQSTNIWCTLLLNYLQGLLVQLGYLPQTLFIQSDNCFAGMYNKYVHYYHQIIFFLIILSDNKNRWLLALLATLVEKNWFSEIQLNMLPPGHTHEDIDALFGEFGQQLPKYPIYDIDQAITEFFPRVYAKRQASIRQLQKVFDWKSYFNNFVVNLGNHSRPRAFKFSLVQGSVHVWKKFITHCYYDSFYLTLVFKMWVKSDPVFGSWQGPAGEGKYGYQILLDVPEDIPMTNQ